ncbi:MAG: VRR-NUC domain-containing protein [SAR324 cluster bacterium]|nr:VRR-NUC domain-containing protein [SAR324 cluster bacterium]
MAIELPEGYYLDNFQKLIGFVFEQYPDLLTGDEKKFYNDFQSCTLDVQRLYVRLISRKGPYFRSDKLHYSEIPQIQETLKSLASANFAVLNPAIDFELLLSLLLREELLELAFPVFGGLKHLKKPEIIRAFLEEGNEDEIVVKIKERYSWICPLRLKELLVYRLCFFGNLHQDLSEFVLLDLGMIRYEDYQIHQEDRYFQERRLLEKTLQMHLLREWQNEVLVRGPENILDFFEAIPEHQNDRTLKRLHNRMTNTLARQLERLEELESATMLYEQSERPPSRERRSRILAKQNRIEEALALCQSILNSPLSEEEFEFAERFSRRLRKQLGLPLQSLKSHRVLEEALVLSPTGDSVELQVVAHFRAKGNHAYFVENHLWRGMFGLAFWDIVFMPLRGAFFNLYQRGPKGLFTAEFREQRQEAIDERLNMIREDPGWPGQVVATFREKMGISNTLVFWPILSEELIQLALCRIPRAHFAQIFDRLSRDLGNNRSGFPDLIIFPKEYYQLLEVKGPGDRLQQNQKRWIKFFHEYEIPYRVVNVTFSNDIP